jgi:hypothetical protein
MGSRGMSCLRDKPRFRPCLSRDLIAINFSSTGTIQDAIEAADQVAMKVCGHGRAAVSQAEPCVGIDRQLARVEQSDRFGILVLGPVATFLVVVLDPVKP